MHFTRAFSLLCHRYVFKFEYNITFWAQLALGTVPLFFGTALHVYTYLFAVPV